MSSTVTIPTPRDALRHPAARSLAARMRGVVIDAGSPGYDEARAVWNGMFDRRPAVIARPVDAADAAEAVVVAAAHGLPLAVRGGGHHVAGLATDDGALVIDLRDLRNVDVDAATRVARVGGGATWADVDAATAPHALAAAGGLVSETGVAGLTLSGGMGWLRRRVGLSCDNLLAAEVVLSDGRIVVCDEDRHPDLYWALRGGGGNFGVVTRFDLRLHPLPTEVDVAFTLYPLEDAARVVAGVLEGVAGLPEGIAPLFVFGRAPEAAPFPPSVQGRAYVAVLALNGEAEPSAGEAALTRLRALAAPLADVGGRMPYVEAQRMLDADYPAGGRYYWTSASLTGLDGPAVAEIVRRIEAMPAGHSTIDVWVQGGAIARVPVGATAYADRSAPLLLNVEANWHHPADDDRYVAWARTSLAALAPWHTGAGYLNFPGLMEDPASRVRRAFGPNYERLARVKAAYDPDNAFRRNQNVTPRVDPVVADAAEGVRRDPA